MKVYKVFSRTWWKENPSWPNGLEPCPGKRHYLGYTFLKEEDARHYCMNYNNTHDAGRLSIKCEYEIEEG